MAVGWGRSTWGSGAWGENANVEVTPSAGSVSLAGAAPSAVVEVRITPAVGSLSLVGAAPSLAVEVIPGSGAVSIVGADFS
jgi:hypothetical protein